MSHNHVDSPGIADFNDDSGFLSDQGKIKGFDISIGPKTAKNTISGQKCIF